MKIFYSCLSRSWGGMEMFTLTAAELLAGRGHSVVIGCRAGSRLHHEALKKNFACFPASTSARGVLSLRSFLLRQRFDLVHTQASKDLWALVPALTLAGLKTPLLLTKQVGSYIVKKDLLHKFLYGRVTYALAISRVIEQNLLDTCPLRREQVLLLHNGIDVRRFQPSRIDREAVRASLGIRTGDMVFGMTARFSPGKGHEEFLYAARALNKRRCNCKYLVVGTASEGEDEYEASIRRLAENYELDNVIFTGFRSDTENMFAAMDVFVFPSHSEALGIALIEAMAMEKACVGSNSDGVLDLIIDGETGLLFEKKNGEDLALAMEALAQSSELRERLGKAARRYVEANFDLEILTDRALEIYARCLSK